jgi:hypothetical protein
MKGSEVTREKFSIKMQISLKVVNLVIVSVTTKLLVNKLVVC